MKLTPAQVLEIRSRFKSGHDYVGDKRNDINTATQLAREYGVSISLVSRIVRGTRWGWLIKPNAQRGKPRSAA